MSTTSQLSVHNISAFSDSELAHFMEKHRTANGDFVLPVDGWDKLLEDERNRLAERLKYVYPSFSRFVGAC